MKAERRRGGLAHTLRHSRVSASGVCEIGFSVTEISPWPAFSYNDRTHEIPASMANLHANASETAKRWPKAPFLIAVWKIRTTFQPIENIRWRPFL
ncbi:MAG: hypothetical protein WBZ32_05420, partial [Candidatus Acidiferrales bacterium]